MLLGICIEVGTSLSKKKCPKQFWKELKTIKQSRTHILAETVEGLNNPLSIVDMFVE